MEEALRLAERAATVTSHQNPVVLDVLAAAQAAAGQFDLAVLNCEEALLLLPEGAQAAAVRQRRALYMQRRPYVSR